VRAVFVIDPKGIIRAIIYYPLSLGRNFDELYRVIIALQTADAFSLLQPIGVPVTTSLCQLPVLAVLQKNVWRQNRKM
jgi:alkyl hydroperoxide reductase subunit AhpC